MMKTINIIIIASMLITINSCGFFWDCIEGNGDIMVEYRDETGFDGIVSTGIFDVVVTQDDEFEIKIEADENIIPFIVTEVTGGNLKIYTRNSTCLNPSGSIEIFISMPEIYELKLTGSGIIECDDITTSSLDATLTGSGDIILGSGDGYINTKELYINNTGSGDIETDTDADYIEIELTGSGDIDLFGTTDMSDLTNTGSGKIDADKIRSVDCEAKISGSGSIYIDVEENLKYLITGSGDIYCYGNPKIDSDSKITGSGDFKKLNR